jgi:simple sugar transport system permease protein
MVNWFIQLTVFDQMKNQSLPVAKNANLPAAGLDRLFGTRNINIGIFISVLAVIAIYLILQKTQFGFELKACGMNRDASLYAGINAVRTIVSAMLISGLLSGLGGAMTYLSGTGKFMRVVDVLAEEGFTGISVAFLGTLDPVGILFAGLFIAYITVGGQNMQLFNFSPEIINIIISVIIYFGAFSLLFRELLGRITQRKYTEPVPAKKNMQTAADTGRKAGGKRL